MKKIFILSWPSGVWKTTIYEEFNKKYSNSKLKKIITTTTREKRDYEEDWKDYYFIDFDTFSKKIRKWDFIEYAEVHDNFYGSTFEELEKIINSWNYPFYIVDPQWVKFLKSKLSWLYDVKTIFILPPSVEELKKRLLWRWEDENSKDFKLRVNESLIWLEEKDKYDFNIVNNDLEQAVEEFKNIIEA